MIIPSKSECLAILDKNKTPSNVIEHCKAVCKIAEEIADKLIAKNIKVNKKLVTAAALLHDVEREKKDHVMEGAKLIRKMGFPEVAEVMSKHSLHKIENPAQQPRTYEEKIVFYADKKAKESKIVSLEERFKDLKQRYDIDFTKEYAFAKKIKKELMVENK
ncbi:HDIG domain-containing protein [Candidatus Woesearchaeota archaeon]|nr:HDIG domain-containing protein [Candidatus Woesearchaeota archaeon]